MKLKTKLSLGVGLLLMLIFFLGLVAVNNLLQLQKDTLNILKDNYNSLLYTNAILNDMEAINEASLYRIAQNLKLQESNITENGEAKLTQTVRHYFEKARLQEIDDSGYKQWRKALYSIKDLNMQAIQKRSDIARATSERAVIWIVVTALLCFGLAVILLLVLPSNITRPIAALNKGIRRISENHYSERLEQQGPEEFHELIQSFNVMAGELETYSATNIVKLLSEKKRVEALVQQMQDPVMLLDAEERILLINKQFCKVLGLTESELVNQPISHLAKQNDLLQLLLKYLQPEGKPKSSEPLMIYVDDKDHYYQVQGLPINVSEQIDALQQAGYVLLLKNVTEYKELDAAKTNFIATVSHEFKTPIASIQMSLQLLKNQQIGNLNTEQKNLLDGIQEDADRLLRTTGELLNITQLESGKIPMVILPVELDKIIDYATAAIQSQAALKSIHIEKSKATDFPEVLADSEKTAWVLINLLSNAIRYSHEDSSIRIDVSHDGSNASVKVQDFGQGIAPEYLKKIFDRYFRVPGSVKEGTGLGLAISKDFMEAQGGGINVSSEIGKGSVFELTLQLSKSSTSS